MYTHTNFKTKKALKEAVEKFNAGMGPGVTYYQPGPFGGLEPQDGIIPIEGPHFPSPHRWYAEATARGGFIISVE